MLDVWITSDGLEINPSEEKKKPKTMIDLGGGIMWDTESGLEYPDITR